MRKWNDRKCHCFSAKEKQWEIKYWQHILIESCGIQGEGDYSVRLVKRNGKKGRWKAWSWLTTFRKLCVWCARLRYTANETNIFTFATISRIHIDWNSMWAIMKRAAHNRYQFQNDKSLNVQRHITSADVWKSMAIARRLNCISPKSFIVIIT